MYVQFRENLYKKKIVLWAIFLHLSNHPSICPSIHSDIQYSLQVYYSRYDCRCWAYSSRQTDKSLPSWNLPLLWEIHTQNPNSYSVYNSSDGKNQRKGLETSQVRVRVLFYSEWTGRPPWRGDTWAKTWRKQGNKDSQAIPRWRACMAREQQVQRPLVKNKWLSSRSDWSQFFEIWFIGFCGISKANLGTETLFFPFFPLKK